MNFMDKDVLLSIKILKQGISLGFDFVSLNVWLQIAYLITNPLTY